MKKVLVLEDDTVQSSFLAIKLQQNNFDVFCFKTYESAITAIKIDSFDYYFVDINLGEEKNGIDFIEEVRKKTNAPIIITSDFTLKAELHKKASHLLGYNLNESEQVFETKNIHFFIKPIPYERLFTKITELEKV
ncbi:MAG: response regulator [Bacteroidota bacterium]